MKMYESPKCELLEVQTTENLLLESTGRWMSATAAAAAAQLSSRRAATVMQT